MTTESWSCLDLNDDEMTDNTSIRSNLLRRCMKSINCLVLIASVYASDAINANSFQNASATTTTTATTTDICSTEEFVVRCNSDHVILINSGLYGRMRIGRCVRVDFGFVGCYSDVINILDRHCTGRAECQLRIPDPEMDATRPCLSDLTRYLETTYQCVPVVRTVDKTCTTRKQSAYIQPFYVGHADFVVPQCALVTIIAAPGQRINLTLIDFGAKTTGHVTERSLASVTEVYHTNTSFELHPLTQNAPIVLSALATVCYRYAVVKDAAARTDVDICSSAQRISHAYTSAGHSIDVKLHGQPAGGDATSKSMFLIKYEMIGCETLQLPKEYYWVKTSHLNTVGGDVTSATIVGCLTSTDIWRIKCVNNSWIGAIGNCSTDYELIGGTHFQLAPQLQAEYDTLHNKLQFLPVGVTVLIVVVLATVVGVLITGLGLIIINRCTEGSLGHEWPIKSNVSETSMTSNSVLSVWPTQQVTCHLRHDGITLGSECDVILSPIYRCRSTGDVINMKTRPTNTVATTTPDSESNNCSTPGVSPGNNNNSANIISTTSRCSEI